MYTGRTLFSQVMDYVPWTSFNRIVDKYGGDVRVRTLRCTEHFRVMAFAQVTYRESLRDIEACLGAQPSKLCSMGLREPVAKSTLSDANELRDWRIWSDLAAVLIKRARKLYLKDDIGLDLANTVYALDSTTIDLCLSLFPWADFRSTKAAVKMHTLLDLRGPIPSFIHVSNGKMGDAPALDLITLEAGAIYVMDRGYVDFRRLYVIHQAGAFFVTRTKCNMKYHRVYSHNVDKSTSVGSDQSIALDGFYTKRDYPQHLRRVSFCDPETGKRLVFLTNNFVLSAEMIAALYKKRWAVELFFKWIKQNLRIKHFYGTSENAVKTQIWIAVCVYVLAAIIKQEMALEISLYTFLQILSVHSFEKTQLEYVFLDVEDNFSLSSSANQLRLFDN
ncbi:MAG: IS4 family transposase [bacterium]|nr:IS4 family transposase [bacterium]